MDGHTYAFERNTNRRHAWRLLDGATHAVCTRCECETRVTLDAMGAGLRARVERHGPAKCPGAAWWRSGPYYWRDRTKPVAPWADTSSKATSTPPPTVTDRADTSTRPTDSGEHPVQGLGWWEP